MADECPCGCGQDVPQRAHNHFANRDPFWEWICYSPKCERRHTRMQNQSGDATCSWCGSERSFVGHFRPGNGVRKNYRLTVRGEKVRRVEGHHLVAQTPAHMIRPYQDVT